MSLLCDETGEVILYGTTLYMSTRTGAKSYSALCSEVVDRIPQSERRPKPCEPADKGLDIHKGFSTKNGAFGPFSMNYSWSGMEIRNFLFSISEETARKYLPNHYGTFYGETVEQPRKSEFKISSEVMDEILKDEKAAEVFNELAADDNFEIKIEKGPSH